MKVFITGATGTIGGAALRALVAAGHDVTGLTTRAANVAVLERQGARAVVGDVKDANAYKDVVGAADAIVHAASALPDKMRYSAADVDGIMGADEDAVAALRSVVGKHCRAFVFSSGAWVYGDTGPNPVSETHPTTTPHLSSARRARFEETLRGWAKDGSLPAVMARPGLVYGQGSLWAKLYLDVMKQKKRAMIPGSGRNIVSFVHEDDVGAAYRVLVERGVAGEAYNVADDEPAALRDVVAAQATAMEAPAPWSLPGWVIRLVAGPISGGPLLADSVLSNGKLKALGWELKHPSWREGVVAVAAKSKATST